MTEKEIKLAAHYLSEYASELSGNTCNDVDESLWSDWTIEERQTFAKEQCENAGVMYDPEEVNLIMDFEIVRFLAHKLSALKINHATNQHIT